MTIGLALAVAWPGPFFFEGVAHGGKEQLLVTVATDQGVYRTGETIAVGVTATDSDGAPVADIRNGRLEISDGEETIYRAELVAEGYGTYSADYRIATDARPGTWQIEAKLVNVEATATVTVEEAGAPDLEPGDGETPAADPHADLVWAGAGTCLACHAEEANQVHGSVHYQWQGDTPFMVNGAPPQGKLTNAVNSYCINILGNWDVCGGCHIGLGAVPEATASPAQLANIDCLLCHQKEYKRVRQDGVFVPDEAAMTISMDEAVRTVHLPRRENCLQCHAKAGGGDAVKRGDLALAHTATMDRRFDVHMATTGADLACQECHRFTDHRVTGKGSDLRPTDDAVTMACTDCHTGMDTAGGHDNEEIGRHVARVACQTCHIPLYAKDAADTVATEATETHRTWLATHAAAPPYHPAAAKANNLMPRYRFWNRLSDNALLHDRAEIDPLTGAYPTSRPMGDVADPAAKLYPFKYKTAEQPITVASRQLIAVDTAIFFGTANPDLATAQGLANMGLDPSEPYEWVLTDTFQLLNHEVSPASEALACADCHDSDKRMDLTGALGYALKDSPQAVCSQCHRDRPAKGFYDTHERHVAAKGFDCSWCHAFSRPERGLITP